MTSSPVENSKWPFLKVDHAVYDFNGQKNLVQPEFSTDLAFD